MRRRGDFLGNILIRLSNDQAFVESYFEAYHRLRRDSGEPHDAFLGGRYVDRMERRGEEWRIADRTAIYDWVRSFADSADWSGDAMGLGLQIGTHRMETDQSYHILGE